MKQGLHHIGKSIFKRCAAAILICSLLCAGMTLGGFHMEPAYAASVKNITGSTQIVCKKSAQVKAPSWYKNCKYSSSNKKVATVSAKGKLRALRLGVTTVTIKSGSNKISYTITVIPAKQSDVHLNQEILMDGQSVQLKLVSDKYDTSQVQLSFISAFDEISKKGFCTGINTSYGVTGTVYYSYGSFTKQITLGVYTPDRFFGNMLRSYYGQGGVEADVTYDLFPEKAFLNQTLTVKQFREKGITFYLDGKQMTDRVVYTPGEHVIRITAGKQNYEQTAYVSYSIKNALIKRDATGYAPENKKVLDAAFAALDQVITDGMTEEQKVRAIHDYLIYHANYVNNGDYRSAEKWALGAGGVLLHGEGVCQSYAFAFYMMTTAVGLDCHYVSGRVSTGNHGWNRVKVDGTWYYIDCTWDDPVGGGRERDTYYLSKTLWSDHIAEEETDIGLDDPVYWEKYYLTGEGYTNGFD